MISVNYSIHRLFGCDSTILLLMNSSVFNSTFKITEIR